MKAAVFAVVAIALTAPASAQSRYDRKLEAAAIAIVAATIGDIRGGFAFDAKPVMVVVQHDLVMGATMSDAARMAAEEPLPEGVERAVERPSSQGAAF
ncbi:MAG: hypothetical protein NTV73_12655 [Hyphomicrobiales bacterium]|nr:hypothetical protein [Hyphomicrobiales bacterium]